MKAENRIDLNIDNKGKGRRFESRFLQAGLVKYSFGVCLLSKEVIDRFAYKFVGCPVIIDHKDITDKNAKDERVGVISKVWFNEFDGWFWCEGVVFDDEAISLIKDKGYNVSCQYNIDDYTENTANALHNGNPYDITILDGSPEHLAIVKNPRYEEALIAVNKGDFITDTDSNGKQYVYCIETVNPNYKKELKEIIDNARNNPNQHRKLKIGKVSNRLIKVARENGFDLQGYEHDIDVSGTRHSFNEHGTEKTEEPRGQIPITDEDFEKIPDIIYSYDEIEFTGKNKIGNETITYKKVMPDDTIFYVEEIRTGKKTLSINTMYKHKNKNADSPKTSAKNSNLLSNASIYIIPHFEEKITSSNEIVKECNMKAENTEFRTGYDSEGDAYVYPIDGADEKKSDKKTDKKEDKKPDYQDVIDKYDKKYDVDKNDKGESWYDRASDSELKTDIKDYENFLKSSKDEKQRTEKLLKDDNYSKWHNEFKRQIADLDREIGEYEDRIKYAKAHLEKKQATKSEDKKEDNKYSNRHAEILYKDLPKLREDLHKARYERAKKREQGADVTFYDKKIKELEDKEENLKEEMASIRDSRRKDGDRYKSLIEESKEDKKQPKQLKLFNALEEQLERFVLLVAKNFDESKHKRDEDGKFTDSGNFSGKTVDEQEKELVKELKRLKKNGKAGIDGEKIEDMYKRLTGKEWQSQGAKKEDKKQVKKSQKIDGVKFDKVGKLIPSILKDMEKAYKESK